MNCYCRHSHPRANVADPAAAHRALSDWIEANIRLPEGVSALPGAVRLWPYQREIADAISGPEMERMTLVKPVLSTATMAGAAASTAGQSYDEAPGQR